MLNKRLKPALYSIASLTVLSLAITPAHAQANLEDEIIVTATKRAQSLSDVSAAISVVTPDLLTDAQIATYEDLQVAIPGITVGNDFGLAKIFVRGIGLNASLPGLEPSVPLHVDGAVISQASQQFGSLYDLERVEAVRGPQGTLYGRNATGGSVNLITAKPTEDFEGYTNLTVGGDDLNIIAEGAISGPIAENVQARVAARYQNRDGFGVHTGSGQNIDNANKLGVRGQVNFDISDRVSNLVMAEYYREDERSKTVKFLAPSFSPDVIAGLEASLDSADPLLAATGRLGSLVPLEDQVINRDTGGSQVPQGDLDSFSVTNTFEFEANDTVTFRSITNYRDGLNDLVQDFDVSDNDATPSTVQGQLVENEQFSQEVQFILDGNRWSGVLGGYYFQETLDSQVNIGTDPASVYEEIAALQVPADNGPPTFGIGDALNSLSPAARVGILGVADIDAQAIFGNFTFDVTDDFRVKIGGRYSAEQRSAIINTLIPNAGPGVGGLQLNSNDERSYEDFTPEIGFEYDLGDTLVYGTYSEGFKSGTATLVDNRPNSVFGLIDPETITNWEAGFKGTYLDGSLRLGVAAFLYEIQGGQFDRTSLTLNPPFFQTAIENAATTDGKGLEVEGNWQATDNFKLDFNGTLYDITFDEFVTTNPLDPISALQGLTGATVDTVNLAGNRPRNTPEYSLAVRGTYNQELDNGGEIDYSAAYALKGDQFFTEFNDERLSQDAYGILDANIKYTFPNDNLSLNLWGKNLTDEFVTSGTFAISTSRTVVGTFLPPRQYGATLGYKF